MCRGAGESDADPVDGAVRCGGYGRSVRRHDLRADHAQVAAEYVLVLAGVAVGCIVAVLYFGGTVSGLFDSSGKPMRSAPFRPPASGVAYPASLEDCEDPGWRDYPQFPDEQSCRDYLEGLNP
jgi:Flp pilus assembly pilin Flp